MTTYTQCKLKRKLNDGGIIKKVCFIPNKFAKKNKSLSIKEDNIWVDGWIVEETYDTSTINEQQALSISNEYRKYGMQEIAGRMSRKDLF